MPRENVCRLGGGSECSLDSAVYEPWRHDVRMSVQASLKKAWVVPGLRKSGPPTMIVVLLSAIVMLGHANQSVKYKTKSWQRECVAWIVAREDTVNWTVAARIVYDNIPP